MSTAPPVTPPDQRAFEAHVTRATFIAGVYRGDWSIESIGWPIVVITIAAAAREGAPGTFTLRCDLTNYPEDAH